MERLINGAWEDCALEDLAAGDWYRDGSREQRYTAPNPAPITIVITGVTGDTLHNAAFTKITCDELTNITVTGTLAIPDRLFALPLRRDDGRLFLFPAQVTNGAFSVVVNLPTTGQFTYSDKECNVDLPYQMFTVDTLQIDSLRKIGV